LPHRDRTGVRTRARRPESDQVRGGEDSREIIENYVIT
jgi:hypothetical protein